MNKEMIVKLFDEVLAEFQKAKSTEISDYANNQEQEEEWKSDLSSSIEEYKQRLQKLLV
jgi:hypothetical protein